MLREFDESLPLHEREIADPIGGSYEIYCLCRNQIREGIDSLLNSIKQNKGTAVGQAQPVVEIAFGSDHAGYKLKKVLIHYLEEKGIPVADFGCDSEDRTDYPDYAQEVAASVASRQCRLGMLLCTTGVGMSIAANKTPSIRAALVADEATAKSGVYWSWNGNAQYMGVGNAGGSGGTIFENEFSGMVNDKRLGAMSYDYCMEAVKAFL